MKVYRIVGFSLVTLVMTLSLVGVSLAQVSADSPVKVIRIAEFVAGDDIKMAGIHDFVKVAVLVDESGTVRTIDFLTGPMWPCKSEPKKELASLRASISSLIREAKFEPAKVNGKPVAFQGTFVFKIADSELEQEALNELANIAKEKSKDSGNSGQILLKYGKVRVQSLPEYSDSILRSITNTEVEVRYLVDKTGKVVSAGITNGPKILHFEARNAVCKSDFEPTTYKGKAIPTIQTRTFPVNGGHLVRIQ